MVSILLSESNTCPCHPGMHALRERSPVTSTAAGHGPGPANLRASYCSLYLVTFIFTAQEKSQCDPFSSSRTLILEVETRKASIIHHAGDIQYVQLVRLSAGPRNVLASTLSFSTIFTLSAVRPTQIPLTTKQDCKMTRLPWKNAAHQRSDES